MKLPPESALLLSIATMLVPRRLRADWRREWEAELWWWLSSTPDPARMALACHLWGALADAACLWLQKHSEGRSLRDCLALPSLRLAVPVLLLALVAAASGGFRHTRRALFEKPPDRLAVITQEGPFMGQIMPLPSTQLSDRIARSHTIESFTRVSRTKALCLLKPGVSAIQAQRELQLPNTFLHVTPYAATIVWPIAVLGPPFLGLALLAAGQWLRLGAFRALALAHPLAWLALLFVGAVELPVSPAAIFVPYLIASFVALRLCWRDQAQRCPVCLARLTMPVSIGLGPRSPFEPTGTEFLCPSGHGALFVTSEAEPESHWTPLAAA